MPLLQSELLPAAALFAKAPVPGQVKTRLQEVISPELSASLHRAFVADMWEKLVALDGEVQPVLYSNVERPGFTTPPAATLARVQRGDDLGAKMLNCFRDLKAAGHPRSMILGTDSPTLPRAVIRDALLTLDSADAVLTPVADGGYCLIGVHQPHDAMFKDVAWSTGETLEQTEAALRHAGYRVGRTQAWFDVDVPADLARLASSKDLPEHTRDWFTRHQLHLA